jgi:hypothetical protein
MSSAAAPAPQNEKAAHVYEFPNRNPQNDPPRPTRRERLLEILGPTIKTVLPLALFISVLWAMDTRWLRRYEEAVRVSAGLRVELDQVKGELAAAKAALVQEQIDINTLQVNGDTLQDQFTDLEKKTNRRIGRVARDVDALKKLQSTTTGLRSGINQ